MNVESDYRKSPSVLSKDRAMAWIKNAGFSEDCLSWTSKETFSIEFTIPGEVLKVQALCKEIATWAGEPNEWMVWIKDWPFYKPEEMAVVQAMRKGWGEEKKLIETPGHVFQKNNSEALGLFMLTLLFGWDAVFAPVPSKVAVITYAHESLGTVITKSRELSPVIRKKLEELEIAGWSTK